MLPARFAKGGRVGRSRLQARLRPWLLPGLLVVALGVALADPEIGAARWWRLERDRGEAQARIDALRQEVRQLETQRVELRDDPFAIERAIREDLGLALPGEVLVQERPAQQSLARAR